jgi:alkylation response protein AidB-like acyl-CoA dehydrogenase
MRLGPGKHLKDRKLMNGLVKPGEFDYFHEVCSRCKANHKHAHPVAKLIITQEFARASLRGYGDGKAVRFTPSKARPGGTHLSFPGLLGGKVIGLPPVLNFGSEELKTRVVPDILAGKKFICLAISEAFAGSDVMGLQTTAVKTEDGKHWIINGRSFVCLFPLSPL